MHPAAGSGRRALRILVASAMALQLVGCGHIGQTGIDTTRLLLSSRAGVAPTAESVAANPYAQIRVDWPEGSAVMALGNVDDGRQSWFTDKRHILYLKDGLVVGSFGFGDDAADIRIDGENPLLQLHTLQGQAVVSRRYDWRTGYRYGVPVTGHISRVGMREIEILDARRRLVHFREDLRGPGLRGHNDYWADPDTGFIWKSRQVIAPDLVVEIIQLKPYGPDMR